MISFDINSGMWYVIIDLQRYDFATWSELITFVCQQGLAT